MSRQMTKKKSSPCETNLQRLLTGQQRDEFLQVLTEEEREHAKKLWALWSRPEQRPPPTTEWDYWLYLAGRGAGKTRSGAEWIREQVEEKNVTRVALVGPTAADVRDVMCLGESGLIETSANDFRPVYEPSKRRLIWPNGAIATLYSSEEPDRLRGPQHEVSWSDELAAWKSPETWDMLSFGMRLGRHPQSIITTTPKPTPFLKRIMRLPNLVTTRGSMLDNKVNLPDSFINAILNRYQGTRLGKQEIEGLYLDAIEGALFSEEHIMRRDGAMKVDDYDRICVAVDPAVSAGEGSDETGILVCGSYNDGKNADVLEDKSGHYKPNEWADEVVRLYHDWKADKVLGEVNNGGDLVEFTLRHAKGGKHIPFLKLHSSRGKRLRAEPVSGLYEQHRVFHTRYFEQLEEQMVTFNPEELAKKGESPDRVDALVFCLTWLIIERKQARVRFLYD